MRSGVLACLEEASRHDLKGVVIIGAGRGFIVRSDIREFGAPLLAPELPDVIAVIEACPHLVCAAIQGAALGGGFELALGCDLRVGAPDAIVGLPEVTLGMIPGAGGTQCLPRLVGVGTAITQITSGTRVPASEALQLGMLDAVAKTSLADDLISCAMQMLESRPAKRVLRHLPVPESEAAAVDAAQTEALKEERAVFQGFRVAPEAFALRHLFFSERAAARMEGLSVKRTAIMGHRSGCASQL